MKSTGKAKKKTLYGRYDDYDLPEDGVYDSDESAPVHGSPGTHAQRLTDLFGGTAITAYPCAVPSAKVGARPGEQTNKPPEEGEDSLRLAICKGMELLGYGDLSSRRMIFKLTSRGIEPETAHKAAAWLTAHGMIREDDAAWRRAMQGARKLWGPHRILQDLRAQGYSTEVASAALDALTGADCDAGEELPSDCVDFEVNCAALIRKKYGSVPVDRAERQKMIASLMRLGYDADTIREAASSVMSERDP